MPGSCRRDSKRPIRTPGGDSSPCPRIKPNYETPHWVENGWLVNLSEYARTTPGYDENDFIPSLRESRSYQETM